MTQRARYHNTVLQSRKSVSNCYVNKFLELTRKAVLHGFVEGRPVLLDWACFRRYEFFPEITNDLANRRSACGHKPQCGALIGPATRSLIPISVGVFCCRLFPSFFFFLSFCFFFFPASMLIPAETNYHPSFSLSVILYTELCSLRVF